MIVKCHFLFQSIIPTFDLISAIHHRVAFFRPNPLSFMVYFRIIVFEWSGRGIRPSWVSTESYTLPIFWQSSWAPPVSIGFCHNDSIFPFHGCHNSITCNIIFTWHSYSLEQSGNWKCVLTIRVILTIRYFFLFSINVKSEDIVTLYIERELWKVEICLKYTSDYI